MTKLRVFLADDHAVVREGLKALINAQTGMEVVGEAGDGQAALDGAARMRPDVVVMDISMPGLSGARATEQLKQAGPDTSDVFTEVSRGLDQHLWFLEAHLQG